MNSQTGNRQVGIARNASDLAFQIGQEVQRFVTGRAVESATRRGGDADRITVTVEDIRSVLDGSISDHIRALFGDSRDGGTKQWRASA